MPPDPFHLQPVYEFSTPDFSGFIRPSGHYHGLVLTHDAEERPITRPGRCFLNLEHYEARGRQGLFVPREACQHQHRLVEAGVEIDFSPTEAWKFTSQLCLLLRPQGVVDARFHFHFLEDLRAFEVFVASYFPNGVVPPWIKMGGRWVRPAINRHPREQLFIPRDETARSVIADGRWQILDERGYVYRIWEASYDLPVMVTMFKEGFDRPVVIQMVEHAQCLALSPNVFAPAHDFSLLGADVQAGEAVSARARLIYRHVSGLEEVEELYRAFQTELNG